jgi:hypothetical protein
LGLFGLLHWGYHASLLVITVNSVHSLRDQHPPWGLRRGCTVIIIAQAVAAAVSAVHLSVRLLDPCGPRVVNILLVRDVVLVTGTGPPKVCLLTPRGLSVLLLFLDLRLEVLPMRVHPGEVV